MEAHEKPEKYWWFWHFWNWKVLSSTVTDSHLETLGYIQHQKKKKKASDWFLLLYMSVHLQVMCTKQKILHSMQQLTFYDHL